MPEYVEFYVTPEPEAEPKITFLVLLTPNELEAVRNLNPGEFDAFLREFAKTSENAKRVVEQGNV